MKKALDQTVRDLKREVNKKVLKVPAAEQQTLDATSNEPWGPHGTLLADIAQASRNQYEYQMIMNIIWKRMSDTGKNWRHVYKALIVLDYLVANGTERVIDDIKEHSYQISALADFQYIDSSGRDQGNNVRRKSQSLIALVSDRERIQEVREKAHNNRDKYRSADGFGGSYGNDRSLGGYGGRYDDRNGNGAERDWGYRDNDKYGGGDQGRDGERRGYDERYGRENGRDDEYRSQGNDDNVDGSRWTSRERDHPYSDEDNYSSRGRGSITASHDEEQVERKASNQQLAPAPPSYEEATQDTKVNTPAERGINLAPPPKVSSPQEPRLSSSSGPETVAANISSPQTKVAANISSPQTKVDGFDEFDPRGSISSQSGAPVAPTTRNTFELDLFGSEPSTDPVHSLALVVMEPAIATADVGLPASSGFEANTPFGMSSASGAFSEPGANPFGDPPFKATPEESLPAKQLHTIPSTSFQPHGYVERTSSAPLPTRSFDFGDEGDFTVGNNNAVAQLPSFPHSASSASDMQAMDSFGIANESAFLAAPTLPTDQLSFLARPAMQDAAHTSSALPPIAGLSNSTSLQGGLYGAPVNLPPSQPTFGPVGVPQTFVPNNVVPPSMSFPSQPDVPQSQFGIPQPFVPSNAVPSSVASVPSQVPSMNIPLQQSSSISISSEMIISAAQAGTTQPVKKFEPKSTVWSDTLSRGLVDLNISGPKINPHADLGIDFDSMNRKERREEKKSAATPMISTVTMGKAMGAGSGIGRAGAGAGTMAPPPNPMGIGAGRGAGIGMARGGYTAPMNQPMGVGMAGNYGVSMGMGMNVRPPTGIPQGAAGMPGGGYTYNPMNYGYGAGNR